jgi:choline-glycine betaine transporter
MNLNTISLPFLVVVSKANKTCKNKIKIGFGCFVSVRSCMQNAAMSVAWVSLLVLSYVRLGQVRLGQVRSQAEINLATWF